jgi:hypothetical protein
MKRAIKVTMICPIEIDDDTDINDIEEIESRESEAVEDDMFCTEYLCKWESLEVSDIGEWQE